jgi:hypothetical protein
MYINKEQSKLGKRSIELSKWGNQHIRGDWLNGAPPNVIAIHNKLLKHWLRGAGTIWVQLWKWPNGLVDTTGYKCGDLICITPYITTTHVQWWTIVLTFRVESVTSGPVGFCARSTSRTMLYCEAAQFLCVLRVNRRFFDRTSGIASDIMPVCLRSVSMLFIRSSFCVSPINVKLTQKTAWLRWRKTTRLVPPLKAYHMGSQRIPRRVPDGT